MRVNILIGVQLTVLQKAFLKHKFQLGNIFPILDDLETLQLIKNVP